MANATITVLEADGVTQTDVVVLDVARQAAAASKSVALATEDKAVLDAIAASAAIIDDNMVAPGTAIGSTKNALMAGSVTTAAPTYTTGQVSPLNLDTAGNLRVNVAAGGAAGGTSSTVGAAAPATATAVGFSDGTNMALGRIKAASTAAVAADPAIVVAISPNGQNANGQTTMSASAPVVLPSDQSAIPTKGNLAHDAADTSNPPVKTGAKATSSLSALTLVSTGDVTDKFAGLDGVQIVRPHSNLEDIVTGNATNTDGTSTSCIAAQAAGIKTYLSSIVLCNTSATAITVDIKDGSTTKVSLPLPAGSGCVYNPPVPIPGTAATAWSFDPSAAATTVTCSMVGFKSKV